MLLETRGDVAIAWLNRPPANPLSPQAVRDLIDLWEEVEGKARALVIASSNIFTFSAGADIKEFTKMSPDAEGADLVEDAHRFMRGMEQSSTVTIAAVNSIAFGGGCELAMACDFRIAAESATFGQPEINLGIIPGFGGTQRLPRLVGEAKALEMNLTGDPIDAYEAHRVGLANQVVPDHELFDTALSWARKLSEQAPIAIEEIKKRSAQPDLDEGLRGEGEGFARAFGSEDAKEGISAFLDEAPAAVQGQVRAGAPRPPPRPSSVAALLRDSERAVVLTGAGISVPSGIPDFRSPGHRAVGERGPDGGRAHRRLAARPRPLLELLRRSASPRSSTSSRTRRTSRIAELERRGLVRAVITQNIDRLHRLAGHASG